MELNNQAVELHAEGRHGDATKMYTGAIGALKATIGEPVTHTCATDNDNTQSPPRENQWRCILQRRKQDKTAFVLPSSSNETVANMGVATPSKKWSPEWVSLSEPLLLPEDAVSSDGIDLVAAVILYNLSLSHASQGENNKALLLLEMCMNMEVRHDSDDDRHSVYTFLVIASQYNIGLLYHAKGNDEGAMEFICNALTSGRENLGNNVWVASMLHKVGHILFKLGQLEGADAAFRETFRMYEQVSVAVCNEELENETHELSNAGAPAA